MRRLALLLVLIPSLASADKVFKNTKDAKPSNETWDCATDPVVKITADKGTFGLLGECKRVTVTGKKNVLSIASATKLVVGGSSNFVNVEEAGTIAVSGKNNQVTWTKAKTGDKPKVTSGGSNSVKQKK